MAEVLVVAVAAIAGDLPDYLISEGQHAGLVDGGFGLLTIEENLM